MEGKVLKMDVSLPILQQRHLAVEGNGKREITMTVNKSHLQTTFVANYRVH